MPTDAAHADQRSPDAPSAEAAPGVGHADAPEATAPVPTSEPIASATRAALVEAKPLPPRRSDPSLAQAVERLEGALRTILVAVPELESRIARIEKARQSTRADALARRIDELEDRLSEFVATAQQQRATPRRTPRAKPAADALRARSRGPSAKTGQRKPTSRGSRSTGRSTAKAEARRGRR
ncbi:MAG: hypothetical protein AAFX79_04180 [Planctomycetota bacterium]